MNVAVYLGAYEGKKAIYKETARKVGEWIGSNGNTLIYGGSKVGLMGVIADATLESGGKVIGIEPAYFVENELQHEDISELIITDTMAERKSKMIELADFFIAIPGGLGTLEEISEVLSLRRLDFIKNEVFLLNIDGYYDDLIKFINKTIDEGFLEKEALDKFHFINTVQELQLS